MRIAVFTEVIKREGGGSQVTVVNFANTLAQKGHSVILFVIGKVDTGQVGSIKCRVFEIRSLPFVPIGIGYSEVLEEVKKFNPDIIHLNELFSSFWIG